MEVDSYASALASACVNAERRGGGAEDARVAAAAVAAIAYKERVKSKEKFEERLLAEMERVGGGKAGEGEVLNLLQIYSTNIVFLFYFFFIYVSNLFPSHSLKSKLFHHQSSLSLLLLQLTKKKNHILFLYNYKKI